MTGDKIVLLATVRRLFPNGQKIEHKWSFYGHTTSECTAQMQSFLNGIDAELLDKTFTFPVKTKLQER